MKPVKFAMLRALLFVAFCVMSFSTGLRAQNNSDYFTVVLFGDPEMGMGGDDRPNNHADATHINKWFDAIINMGTDNEGALKFSFANAPGYNPRADLVICMGDMDGDSKTSRTSIEDAFDRFVNAGVPFFTILGNHDVVPDYWNGGDKGVTWGPSGGSAANDHSFSVVNWYRDDTNKKGLVSDMEIFKQSQGGKQAQPFAFTFRGVRFYMGQTYWFQKPYDAPATLFNSAKFYAPNGIISSLESSVNSHSTMPSVWVQHYPLNCADRWWNDTNANGASINPSNTPDYGTAEAKRNKYKDLVSKTKNPFCFSGHDHYYHSANYTANGKTFTDYTSPYFASSGEAFIVLCSSTQGVIEVRIANFDAEPGQTEVLSFDQISSSKAYTLRTDMSDSQRGALYYNSSIGNYMCATKQSEVDYNPSDPNQQWAIITQNGNRYLYNIGASKYACKGTDNKMHLVDSPDSNCKLTMQYDATNMAYPWILKYGNDLLNVNTLVYTPEGVRIGTWSTLDGGNHYSIVEVGEFAGEPVNNVRVTLVNLGTYKTIGQPISIGSCFVGDRVVDLVNLSGRRAVSASPATIQKGVTMYTVYCEPDYPVTDLGNSTHSERYTTAVKLQNPRYVNTLTVSGLQTATGQKMYWDRTDAKFTCKEGDELTPSVDFNGGWMHAYVYVDENQDGFSVAEDDIVDNVLVVSPDVDLRTYSYYQGYNSLGASKGGGVGVGMPSFTAPSVAGTYRMRYKVDWNSTDPQGNHASNNLISANGGIIVDVMLEVQSDNTGIDTSRADHADQRCYDMSGRRLNGRPSKGLYIVGGKKVLVK